jgi:3-methyladenine DNA glycosylase AlkD
VSTKISYIEILDKLKSLANPQNVAGMARYGINTQNTLGISIPVLRQLAREIGKSHELASLLWESGIHEGRLLAGFIEVPSLVTESQMDRWVNDFDSWDICDQCCSNLFAATPLAFQKALEWSTNEKEFIKRAGFSMMACLAVKGKKANDRQFEPFFVNIKSGAHDNRNFVKKAVNWALRQIGKRNPALNQRAIEVAEEIRKMDSSSARWIASDALRELNSTAVQTRLKGRR